LDVPGSGAGMIKLKLDTRLGSGMLWKR
jgi:hypothetical protein